MKYNLASILVIALSLVSCNQDKESKNTIYVGGQIANPNSPYVVVSYNDENIDTLHLDEKNRFGKYLKKTDVGLYVFKHHPENQIMFLEPGDSTMIWVNTLAFDESINYSGKGFEKNNFLTDLFLQSQKNNDVIVSSFKANPKEFAKKSDSIREGFRTKLRELHEKSQFSEEFLKIANSSIDYEFYDLRERYAFLIRKYNPSLVKDIPKNFHDYRNDVSFNTVALEDSYIYLNFIDDFLRTKSLEHCASIKSEDKDCSNLISFENIKYRMELVDSLIQNERIKNIFLDRLVSQGIIYSQKAENVDMFLKLLKKSNYSGNMQIGIDQMAKLQADFLPGYSLGNKKYLTTNKDTILLKNMSYKPRIHYRWACSAPNHHRWQHEIIKTLRFKYPEIAFIGINLDQNNSDEWIKTVKENNYDPKYEFKATEQLIEEKLLKNYLNKLIFMKPNGEIVRADIQLNSPDLETKILEFISGR